MGTNKRPFCFGPINENNLALSGAVQYCNSETMVISDEQLNEFIAAYKELYGKDLDRQTAYDILANLVNLFRLANKHIFDL